MKTHSNFGRGQGGGQGREGQLEKPTGVNAAEQAPHAATQKDERPQPTSSWCLSWRRKKEGRGGASPLIPSRISASFPGTRASSLDLRLLGDSAAFGYFRQPVVLHSGTFGTLRLKTRGCVLRRRASGFRGWSLVYGTPGLNFPSGLVRSGSGGPKGPSAAASPRYCSPSA